MASRKPLLLAASLLLGAACADSDSLVTSGSGDPSSGATTGAGAGSGTGASTGAGLGANEGAGGGGELPDPCSGAADGAHCGGDLGGLADHGSVYVCLGGATESVSTCAHGCAEGGCTLPPVDPCASASSGDGVYCGGSLTGGDPAALYTCQGGGTASKTICEDGCHVNPPGTPDACEADANPCATAPTNGLYCGGSLTPNGDLATLYDCQGGQVASAAACPAGCQMMPQGTPDKCMPTNGGSCCVERPPGALTQSYSACGNGGSHYGVDYGTPIGTPIYAGISGTVVGSALGYPNCYNGGCTSSCWNAFNYVKVKSDCGDPSNPGHDLYVYYLHIDSLGPGITNGAQVVQGQLLALSGNSGCSSGPHIHIETVSVPASSSASLSTCSSVDPTSIACN
jgi:hypothetical protein